MTTAVTASTTSTRTQPASMPPQQVWRYPLDPRSVRAARCDTVEQLHQWALDELAETAALVVSELATNALLASQQTPVQALSSASNRSASQIALRLTYTHQDLVIEMWDQAPGHPARQTTDPTADNGRGLLLLTTLARTWGCYPLRSSGQSRGKVVWAALAHQRPPTPSVVPDKTASDALHRRTLQPRGAGESGRPTAVDHDLALLQRVIDRLRALDDWTSA